MVSDPQAAEVPPATTRAPLRSPPPRACASPAKRPAAASYYYPGCVLFARWDGRPKTPPFVWGEDGDVLPPHDAWLTNLNLKTEGLTALANAQQLAEDPEAVAQDLEATKSILIQYSGAMQVRMMMMMINILARELQAGAPRRPAHPQQQGGRQLFWQPLRIGGRSPRQYPDPG